MAIPLSPQERYDLVVRRMVEVTGGKAIEEVFATGRAPKTFWATAPTGKPHIAYLVPLIKLAEMVKAGVDVTIQFLDHYAFLVNHKASLDLVLWRTKYYRLTFAAVLEALGVPVGKIHFVDCSSYEFRREFVIDNYKLLALASVQDAQDAGAEYRKPGAKISVLLCPGLQSLGEEYLDADFQFGGEDQRGIFEYADRLLPQLGYRKRAHMMNAMIPGLSGEKMSASIPDSNIGFLDPPEVVQQKLERAVCKERVVAGNGLLILCKEVLIPLCQLRNEGMQGQFHNGEAVAVNQVRSDNGATGDSSYLSIIVDSWEGPTEKRYTNYKELEADFEGGMVSPRALKLAIGKIINMFLGPLREVYDNSEEWQRVDGIAYLDTDGYTVAANGHAKSKDESR